jgi:hypothetical protein
MDGMLDRLPRPLVYYAQYLRRTDLRVLAQFARGSAADSSRTAVLRLIAASILYSARDGQYSPLEYFQFGFPSKNEAERREYAGTAFMYEFQRIMNPKGSRRVLEDKTAFFVAFQQIVKRRSLTLAEMSGIETLRRLDTEGSGRVVAKRSTGQAGKYVRILDLAALSDEAIRDIVDRYGFDLFEQYVASLAPKSVNTVRVITQRHEAGVEFVAFRLRFGTGSEIDNISSGGLATALDATGRVTTPAISYNPALQPLTKHPQSGTDLLGFQVPNWEAVRDLAERAALNSPGARSVGWDIAVTPDGAELIEGNHNWGKLLWQMPVRRGLKADLTRYLRS